MTKLPIILKGIMHVEDAREAVKRNAAAIILSNHGGRQLDGAPSALEVALEIKKEAPEIFGSATEVFADGGVRYGADALMLLSLGVKAVGIGRPFMYANVLGQPGVERAITLMKNELALDAGNLGVADLQKLQDDIVSGWNRARASSFSDTSLGGLDPEQLDGLRLGGEVLVDVAFTAKFWR